MRAVVVIPARLASTRLPSKPLLDETGKALVCHVLDQAKQSKLADEVIVATDDEKIFDVVVAYGGQAVMTRVDHPNGTSRIAEVAEGLSDDVDVIVNVQGDEPEIEPEVIDALIERMRSGDEPMATIATLFTSDDDPENPNLVKVVWDVNGRAMYFSRSCIPHDRDSDGVAVYKHVGIYAYRPDFLKTYCGLPETRYEVSEKLEQLRVLEHGYDIAVVEAARSFPGIDTREQYDDFVSRVKSGDSIICS